MDRLKVLITGGNGYIAKSIYSNICNEHDVILISRTELDFTRREEVQQYFKDKYFDIVIHTAVRGGSRLKPLEDPEIVLINLLMYDNLMRCRDRFDRLIHFGSGAEEAADSPYGFSKHIISELMKLDSKSINIKIYAVFDENELDTRFIKGNILRYINREDIVIHQDKQMDFFYMKDLISLIKWVINQHEKEYIVQDMNCSYLEKYTLTQIAGIINSLDEHKVGIKIENKEPGANYSGGHPVMPFPLIGLEQGIKEIYNILK
jgi:nucleoside-diphosphate-sugar epimerase